MQSFGTGMREAALAKGRWRSGHLYIFGKSGGIYSLHLPGTAVLTAPGYALDRLRYPPDPARSPRNLPFLPSRLPFTRLTVLLLSMASLVLLFRLLGRLAWHCREKAAREEQLEESLADGDEEVETPP